MLPKIRISPVTPDRWHHLVALFGSRGACGGCWCMYWRRPAAEFTRGKRRGNREALRSLVAAGAVPGVLAYADGVPVGWCSVAPRDAYPRLERARVLRRVAAEPGRVRLDRDRSRLPCGRLPRSGPPLRHSPHHAPSAGFLTGLRARRLRIFRTHDLSDGHDPERGRSIDPRQAV